VSERRWDPGWLLCCAAAAVVLLFLVLPLFIIIPISFSAGSYLEFPPPGWSVRWYAAYVGDRNWREATSLSLRVALATTVLATVLGTAAALPLARRRFRGQLAVLAFLYSPLVVPVIVTAIALYFFLAGVRLIGSFVGLLLAHTILALPFVIITVSAALRGFDESLEEAAMNCGATRLVTFTRVTLPLIAPGVLSGALFAFITSFDEIVITMFISGTHAVTLPKQMWDGIRDEVNPTIAAVASLLVGVSCGVLFLVNLFGRRAERLRSRRADAELAAAAEPAWPVPVAPEGRTR
jgi:putative spermidine/putrescine transport system permease protein